jgi:hypothetical protein
VLACHLCKRAIKSKRESMTVKFPPLTLRRPVAVHLECYKDRLGRNTFRKINRRNWLNPPAELGSFSFVSKYGVPTNPQRMLRFLAVSNLIMLPLIAGSIYFSVLAPILWYIITVPEIALWGFVDIVQIADLIITWKIEESLR